MVPRYLAAGSGVFLDHGAMVMLPVITKIEIEAVSQRLLLSRNGVLLRAEEKSSVQIVFWYHNKTVLC